MNMVYVVQYTFDSFGLEEFRSDIQTRYFDSYREYQYWMTDLEHDKTLRNHNFLGTAWLTEDAARELKWSFMQTGKRRAI